MSAAPPLILNFDESVRGLPQAKSVDLTAWQEKIRFAAKWADFRALEEELARLLPPPALCGGTVFLGSGDYHHISYLLIKRLGSAISAPAFGAGGRGGGEKLDAVILDNHPDNMRYPLGIHCGSWVSHLAALPFIGKIDVVGITSNDIGAAHAAENRLKPLLSGRLTYWSCGVKTGWARLLGLGGQFRSFAGIKALTEAFIAAQSARRAPLYFSLDKDVLSPFVARTNWDQGQMEQAELTAIIQALKPRIIGADIVGEVSTYHYQSRLKRLMSRLDGQGELPAAALGQWQAQAAGLNRILLKLLA